MFETIPKSVKIMAVFMAVVSSAVLQSEAPAYYKAVIISFAVGLTFLSYLSGQILEEIKRQ
jgi:Na+-transporting NADH:ubiquinone oxidoreductase subunit NqrB